LFSAITQTNLNDITLELHPNQTTLCILYTQVNTL
jgi:hypothetical protein